MNKSNGQNSTKYLNGFHALFRPFNYNESRTQFQSRRYHDRWVPSGDGTAPIRHGVEWGRQALPHYAAEDKGPRGAHASRRQQPCTEVRKGVRLWVGRAGIETERSNK